MFAIDNSIPLDATDLDAAFGPGIAPDVVRPLDVNADGLMDVIAATPARPGAKFLRQAIADGQGGYTLNDRPPAASEAPILSLTTGALAAGAPEVVLVHRVDMSFDAARPSPQGLVAFTSFPGFSEIDTESAPPTDQPPQLVDIDGDGDRDIVVFSRVLTNHTRQIAACNIPRIGRDWVIKLENRTAPPGTVLVPFFRTDAVATYRSEAVSGSWG